MTLSKNGHHILLAVSLDYSYNDNVVSLTTEKIVSDVKLKISQFRMQDISEEEIKLIVRKIVAQFGVVKNIDEVIVDINEYKNTDPTWFSKIKNDHNDWFTAYKLALFKKDWSPVAINKIDESSDAIMNFLGNPKSNSFSVRGLVMGDVQSGKTANFLALCNKAADSGYRVIIVTAGIIEKLRRQTQQRLEKEFVNLIPGKKVGKLTGITFDFTKDKGENPVDVFSPDIPVLCVVKKNVTVLKHLFKWLQSGVHSKTKNGDILLPWPMLFIDDEADNASINTKDLLDEANPTRTNELIRKILKSFQKSSYVGITATPFANVFIDPDTESEAIADDLFPRSFVYRLTPPSNYFGSDKLFEPGSPFLVDLNDIEPWLPSNHKKDQYPNEPLPESLQAAIGYFFIVNGIMDYLVSNGESISHRSMMIHISRFIAIQNRVASFVESYVNSLRRKISNYCGNAEKAEREAPEIKDLHKIWASLSLSARCDNISWSSFLKKYLAAAIDTIEVVTVNSKGSTHVLDYSGAEKRVIVIGGNALSRGLTLEGLVVSYFRRDSMMSDTLLQMGRWCGYRGCYESLVRVWLPSSAIANFGYSTDISNDLSDMFHQIVEQNGSPKDFAFKIRKAPSAMLPTARNKMRSAVKVKFPVILSGHAIETPRIHNDSQIISANNKAIVDFLNHCAPYIQRNSGWDNMVFYRNVPQEMLLELLAKFKCGMMSYGFMIPGIANYIGKLNSGWDIAIQETNDTEFFDSDGKLPIHIRKAYRHLTAEHSGREILINGTKLKVTSGGVMRYSASPDSAHKLTTEYKKRYGKQPSDSKFLELARMEGSRPLLVIQYVVSSKQYPCDKLASDSFFALSFGFPGARNEQSEEEYFFTKRAYEEHTLQEYFSTETES